MRDGSKPCYGLNEKELGEIKELSLLCNKVDEIRMKLNWDMLRERSSDLNNDFLYYKDDVLVGFLGIYSFNSYESEISGMVHPDYRRSGVFWELTQAAMDVCRSRALRKLIFICPRSSASGKAFLDALGSICSFSEYRMELLGPLEGFHKSEQRQTVIGSALDQEIRLREADERDTEILIKLNMSGFSMSEKDARDYVAMTLQAKGEKTYIADLGTLPIGKISAQLSEASGFIYGFCVLDEYRGKGYGRRILAMTLRFMLEQEPEASIALEVAVENESALGLYESCGFKEVVVYDYHEHYL